jgi:hypothetical protein
MPSSYFVGLSQGVSLSSNSVFVLYEKEGFLASPTGKRLSPRRLYHEKVDGKWPLSVVRKQE